MQRLFLPNDRSQSNPYITGTSLVASGQDHIHLVRVMRAKVGDHVTVLDNLGGEFTATICGVERSRTLLVINNEAAGDRRPMEAFSITVAQALGKGDKFETVIQHGTEAGAGAFVPIEAERCVVEFPREAARAAEKIARWSLIAKGAAEQCGLMRIPTVCKPIGSMQLFSVSGGCAGSNQIPVVGVDEQETRGVDSELRLLLHPDEGAISLRALIEPMRVTPKRIMIAVGPEGGWSERERTAAIAGGWTHVSIGPRTLRTETAALVAVSQLVYRFENVL